MKKLKLIMFYLSVSVFLLEYHLFSYEGTTAATFLKFSESAREASLAGAYSSIGDDSNSIFSNPASIINVEKRQVSLGFTSYIQDSKLGLFSFVSGKNDLKFGFGVSAFNVDGIEKRGSIDQSGIMPSEGSFSSNDIAVFVSYARKNIFSDVIDNLNGGLNLKFIRSKIDTSQAYSIAMDLGFLYNYSDKMRFSFVLSNLGTKMKFEDEGDNLPLSIKAGGSYFFSDAFRVVGEIREFVNEAKFYPSLGVEYLLKEGFAIRTGYKFGYDNSNLGKETGLSLGFGINTKDVSFNYANVFFGELGNVNKFDISLKF
jgi:hypothetical protein